MTRSATQYGDSGRIDPRLRISALWIAVLVIFAYVDLFSLYRPDFRADLEQGKVDAFDVDILGSIVETILLALVIHHAWTWPRQTVSPREG
jgi:hypothetical protein